MRSMVTDFRMSSCRPYLWAILLMGAVCGAAIVYLDKNIDSLLLSQCTGLSVGENWMFVGKGIAAAFGRGCFWFAAFALSGVSAFGAVPICTLLFCRGLGDGYLIGLLLRLGAEGIPYVIRVLSPSFLMAMILVECCSESLNQSLWLFDCIRTGKASCGRAGLRGLLFRYLGCLLSLLLVSCADAGCGVAAGILIQP